MSFANSARKLLSWPVKRIWAGAKAASALYEQDKGRRAEVYTIVERIRNNGSEGRLYVDQNGELQDNGPKLG